MPPFLPYIWPMSETHEVAEGECLSSIAFRYGFFVDTLWNDPANAELKALRKDPAVLKPGDRVFIPDKRGKTVAIATGARHRFRRKGIPAQFKVRLMDGDKPQANLEYELRFDDGTMVRGRTGQDGSIVASVSPAAVSARLTIRDGAASETYDFLLGRVDPIAEISGIQARLHGLGLYRGPIDGEETDALQQAVLAFQKRHGLPATGAADDGTRKKLAAEFGS